MLEKKAATKPKSEEVTTPPVASWAARAGGLALDVVPGLGVLATLVLVGLTFPLQSWQWYTSVVAAFLVVVGMAANRWYLPTGKTRTSYGRAVFGIEVTRAADGKSPGWGRLLLRDLAHLLDTAALFVGWLWPLWDSRRRTFADLLLRTEARRVTAVGDTPRRVAATVLVAATALAGGAVALSYLTVYRPELAVERARAEIKDQGPRIVQDVLSYGAGSMKDDFAAAQGLVTDAYRPQLLEQQRAAEERPAANNEYWAVANSILSATADRASMLLYLQGQRGQQEQDVRFISATVRVEFEKHGDSWQVNNLTVLSRPAASGQTGGGG